MTNAKVLIVEDNELNSEVLQTLLEREGVDCISTNTPHDIVSLVTNMTDLQVLFLDLEFPNVSGFDIYLELKRHPDWDSSIKVIGYSVNTSEMHQARQAGFNGFIGKPINPSDFPKQWEKILNGEAVWSIS